LIDALDSLLTVFIEDSPKAFIVFISVTATEGLIDGESEPDGLTDGLIDGDKDPEGETLGEIDGESEGLIDGERDSEALTLAILKEIKMEKAKAIKTPKG